MANTTTTPTSVAARLTDEEILKLAKDCDGLVSIDYATREPDYFGDLEAKKAAVLRDYVRMRSENAKLRIDADLYKGASENWERRAREAEARLDAVVKVAKEQFEIIFHSPMCWDENENESHSLEQLKEMDVLEMVVATARGESENENR